MVKRTPRKKAATGRKKATPRKKKPRAKKRGRKKPKIPAGDLRPHSNLLAQKGEGCFTDLYLEAVRRGLKKKECARYAGCDETTPREWAEIAEEDFTAGRESLFTAFVIAVRKAKTDRVFRLMGLIEDALERDWHAVRYALSLEGYQAPKQVEVSGSVQTGTYDCDDQDESA